MDLIDQVKEKVSVFKNLYDVIRIVDPLKNKVITIMDNKTHELDRTCYELWKKEALCENCISLRSYESNSTFIKIEHDMEKVVLLIATPVEINGDIFIAEMLRDITKDPSILNRLAEDSSFVEELISSINKKVNRESINNKNIKLLNLNEQINHIRDILNEVCCTMDTSEINPNILSISQCLDELIVEYMKEINNLH
jgi:RNase P/RNase MRP subunit p30